jgi:hypothetical protein
MQNRLISNFFETNRILKLLVLVLMLLASFTSALQISTFANTDQATTDATLKIKPLILNSLVFSVSPKEIFVAEKLTFTLGPATSNTNVVLNNIPCQIWILPASNNKYIVVQGLTNSTGYCSYQTDKTLQEQGLTLVQNTANTISPQFNINDPNIKGGNTNLTLVNTSLGDGFAFGAINYQATTLVSNNDNYKVSGGVTDIDSSYGSSSTSNSDQTNSDKNKSGSKNGSTNGGGDLFTFLPRTGGEAISFTLVIAFIIIVIFLISRRRENKDEDDKKQK